MSLDLTRLTGFNAIQLAGNTTTVGTPSVNVLEANSSGMVTRCTGATVPTDADAGYAKGCEFVKTNGGVATTLYVNEGSDTSADFNAMETSASTITGVTAGAGMTGGGTEGTVTLNVINTDGNLLITADSTDLALSPNVAANLTFTKEVNHNITVTTSTTTDTAGATLTSTSGAGVGTGAGGVNTVKGGASGAGATGNGGNVAVTGGASLATAGNGGSIVETAGVGTGSGVNGVLFKRSPISKKFTVTAMTTSATITVGAILGGMISANQGAAGAASYTMPTGAVLAAALPSDFTTGDSLDFTICNVSAVDAEDVTLITAASGITLKGNVVVEANSASTKVSQGTFRCLCTGASTFDVYRVS